ncbi:ABC transporter permease, partial [Candidatus Woesearchaeota archaeon]|nr:ABC transporter permease [Candidatus Woesearchaeota archaeon]
MINKQLIKTSIINVIKRRARSLLTILSVLIGVTSIFVLISFGQGLVGYVDDLSQEMGNDKLIVQSKGFGIGTSIENNVMFRDKDVNFLEDSFGVDEAVGLYFQAAPIEIEEKRKYVFIAGSNIKENKKIIEEIYNLELFTGSDLDGSEKGDAVLGYNYLLDDDTFPNPLEVRDKVLINGVEVKVKGFYEAVGNPADDYNVYMTKEGFEDIFNPKSYQMILVRSSEGFDPSKLAEKLTEGLREDRGQSRGNEDFHIQTFEQAIASFS